MRMTMVILTTTTMVFFHGQCTHGTIQGIVVKLRIHRVGIAFMIFLDDFPRLQGIVSTLIRNIEASSNVPWCLAWSYRLYHHINEDILHCSILEWSFARNFPVDICCCHCFEWRLNFRLPDCLRRRSHTNSTATIRQGSGLKTWSMYTLTCGHQLSKHG